MGEQISLCGAMHPGKSRNISQKDCARISGEKIHKQDLSCLKKHLEAEELQNNDWNGVQTFASAIFTIFLS